MRDPKETIEGPVTGAAAEDQLPFHQWGQLKLLERIGQGTFGHVYRAWDTTLHRQVALKLLRLQTGVDTAQVLLAEGRALARVEHPNVARIYGVEEHRDRTGMWMEFIEGANLDQIVVDGGPLSPAEVRRIGLELCDAVAAVHDAGIVHQDVKPRNVVRAKDGRIVLMDFGASRATGGDAATLSGTPLYMDPELFDGASPAPASDVFGIGVLLYFLLTGAHPVDGTTPEEIFEAYKMNLARSIADRRDDLSPGWVEVIDRATAPDRDARHASVRALRADLAAIDDTVAPAVAVQRHDPRSRLRGAFVVAAMFAVAVLVLAGMYALRDTQFGILADVAFEKIDVDTTTRLEMGDVITSRDKLQITVEPTRDTYLYILNTDSAGNTAVMFPMAGSTLTNPLPAGRHVLPGKLRGDRQGWTFTADQGVENFLLVASSERLIEFETELERIPTVLVSGGLSVRPAPQLAMHALTRGVAGLAAVAEPESLAATDADFLFGLAREMAASGTRSHSVALHEMRLLNPGSP